jgi:phospholipid transport system substrate-binding protein
MINRRAFLVLSTALLLPLLPGLSRRALAQSAGDRAAAFVKTNADRIVTAMKMTGTPEEKRRVLGPIIDASIDVDGVARFCLGRFWRSASPDQQKRYVTLFHQVLIGNITSKLGEYQDVRLTVGRSQARDDTEVVTTILERPNNPPTTVDWIVTDAATNPKVIDVIAEGTSLRLTQRSDYAAYLTHNNSDVDALIKAMSQQLSQPKS